MVIVLSLYNNTDSLIYHIKTQDIYEELYEDNDQFDFSSYPEAHPNFIRNVIGYTDDNKPIIYKAKVPTKFKEDLILEYLLKLMYASPKVGQLNFTIKQTMKTTLKKDKVKVYHDNLLNVNYNVMILK